MPCAPALSPRVTLQVFRRLGDALHIAVRALERHGDEETLKQMEGVLNGKLRVEARPK